MRLGMLSIGVLLNLFAVDAMAQVPATWLGSWKMDIGKSKSAGPPLKSQIDKNEAVEGSLKYTSDRVYSDGKTGRHEYTAKLDGKDYPYLGSPNVNTISITKADEHTMEWVLKKGGAAVGSGRNTYSPDGKLRTVTWAGMNAKGEKVEGTQVFEKQ